MLIADGLVVGVASVAALALLKILAWRDRRSGTAEDAIDLAHLFSAVEADPYRDEIWADDEAGDLVDFDGSLLGAAWLGRQAGALALEGTRR